MGAVTEIGDLLRAAFGTDVLPREELEASLESERAAVLGMVAREGEPPERSRLSADGGIDGTIVGVSIAREFAEPRALSGHPYVHADPDALLSEIGLSSTEFPVGSVLVTGVEAAYRGRGLGRELSFAAVEFLLERGTTPILQLEWDRPDSPGVETLKAAGYEPRARFEAHFPPEWTCDACDSGPQAGRCTCDVVAFLL